MPVSSLVEALTALEEHDPKRLVGTPESDQIDFKSQPYSLESDKGKTELAKDVAGFANHLGGVVVIGVATQKTPGNFQEIASACRPVPVSLLNAEQYRSVIRDLIRPAVKFAVQYSSDPNISDKGYMTICVEALEEADRWAIVRRIVNGQDRIIEGIFVPIRDSDQTRWLSADEVYHLIRDGQRAGRNLTPISSVSENILPLDWNDAAERLVKHKDWDSPVLIWQSAPGYAVDLLPDMWGNDGIARKIARPPTLRPNGFNWHFLSESTSFGNGVLAQDGRRAMWVQENGSVTAAATVSDDMLAWATRSPTLGPKKINSIALVEMTLEYFRLIDTIVKPRADLTYKHSIATRKFADAPRVNLSSGLPSSIAFHEKEAVTDTRREFASSVDAEHDAFEALYRIYANFQLGPGDVPFSSQGKIDTVSLINWARNH